METTMTEKKGIQEIFNSEFKSKIINSSDEIRNALINASVFIPEHTKKKVVAVDYDWDKLIPEQIKKYGTHRCKEELINLCWKYVIKACERHPAQIKVRWMGLDDTSYYDFSKPTLDYNRF